MASVKPISNTHEHQQQKSQFSICEIEKTAKITMSAAGKNQNTNSGRWAKMIHQYHDFLIRH